MRKLLQKLQQKHITDMTDGLASIFYRYKRYGHKCSALLLYSDTPLDYALIKDTIRLTDHAQKLEDKLILVIFEETDIANAIRASEKLLSTLYSSARQDIYLGVEECVDENEGSPIIRELFSLLDFAIEYKHVNEVIDRSCFDGIY